MGDLNSKFWSAEGLVEFRELWHPQRVMMFRMLYGKMCKLGISDQHLAAEMTYLRDTLEQEYLRKNITKAGPFRGPDVLAIAKAYFNDPRHVRTDAHDYLLVLAMSSALTYFEREAMTGPDFQSARRANRKLCVRQGFRPTFLWQRQSLIAQKAVSDDPTAEEFGAALEMARIRVLREATDLEMEKSDRQKRP